MSTTLSPLSAELMAAQPDPRFVPASGGWARDRSSRFSSGAVIAGRYRIDSVVGSGAMGIVYAASDLRLGRPVAVKVLRSELASDPGLANDFANEALLIAQLSNAHVARVYDSGRVPSGEPFIVMEWLNGESLEGVLAKRPRLPVGEAVDLVIDACAGLSEAHAAGIVHRDIKPANIMLCRQADGTTTVKVVDFGVSKRLLSATDRARAGASFGSPGYMSPEQAQGSENVDARSDVWALGVVLFELLAGHLPFDGNTTVEVFAATLTDPAPPLRAFRRDVDPGLEAVIRRCLEKDPARRFKDAEALRQALQMNSSESLRSAALFGWREFDEPLSRPPKSSTWRVWVGLALAFGLVGLAGWSILGAPWPKLDSSATQSPSTVPDYVPRPALARGVYATAAGLALDGRSLRAEPEGQAAASSAARPFIEQAPPEVGIPVNQIWVRQRRVYKNGRLIQDESQIVKRPAKDDQMQEGAHSHVQR
jgi:serine/threonine protein kinase